MGHGVFVCVSHPLQLDLKYSAKYCYFTKINNIKRRHRGIGFKKPTEVGFKKPTSLTFSVGRYAPPIRVKFIIILGFLENENEHAYTVYNWTSAEMGNVQTVFVEK